ncbi:MAG: TIGR03986 family CRISPR-associated RAMP protein [Nitrospiraceae bacterium]|nr:TIGR03986 family CRISPR-associated RAMP protein [Nitrospiraceae bacterium]
MNRHGGNQGGQRQGQRPQQQGGGRAPHANQGRNARQKGSGGQQQGGSFRPSREVTAPYNFVPLSETVVFPAWAGAVSHDMPFADGINGTIACELTTHSPVFVRDGSADGKGSGFFNVNGEIVIPGTSIKGMVRNVLEIASFGKLNKTDDNRYAIRDLTSAGTEVYRKAMAREGGPKAGWLTWNRADNTWSVTPCSYMRISQTALQGIHPIRLSDYKTSDAKYSAWGKKSLEIRFRAESRAGSSSGPKALPDAQGDKTGILVFTGQVPNKKHESVFYDELPSGVLAVSDSVRKDFEFVHARDYDVTNPGPEWKRWQGELKKGGRVPVFYHLKDGRIKSMGLARMYRLAYDSSVHEAIGHTSKKHLDMSRADFAETLFGYVGLVKGEKETSLRGRVSFSHASEREPVRKAPAVTTILGSPKPTYYPSYVRQAASGEYNTFMDADCEISGWKRYPARRSEVVNVPQPPPKVKSDKVWTELNPLQPGARFVFTVRVHNVRPVELGGLLWALTWGGNPKLVHSLGMGKAFGYGQVSITVDTAKTHLFGAVDPRPVDFDCQALMKKFAEYMEKQTVATKSAPKAEPVQQDRSGFGALAALRSSLGAPAAARDESSPWLSLPEMVQLLSMANPERYSAEQQKKRLQPMRLGNGPRENEFVLAKNGRGRLKLYDSE